MLHLKEEQRIPNLSIKFADQFETSLETGFVWIGGASKIHSSWFSASSSEDGAVRYTVRSRRNGEYGDIARGSLAIGKTFEVGSRTFKPGLFTKL